MNQKDVGRTKGRRSANTKREEYESGREIEFTFFAPEAREVFLAGQFNEWNRESLPLKRNRKGVWKTKLKLPPGTHEYKFLMDGIWVEDLTEAETVPNRFGTQNLIIRI